MTKEQEDSIEILENTDISTIELAENTDLYTYSIAVKNVLNMLKEKDEEIEKKDNAIKKIINRLDNDIKRIAETKRDRSTFPNYLDDYTKCRLKAYKTKTKEIKEYIKKQYFERKIR